MDHFPFCRTVDLASVIACSYLQLCFRYSLADARNVVVLGGIDLMNHIMSRASPLEIADLIGETDFFSIRIVQ